MKQIKIKNKNINDKANDNLKRLKITTLISLILFWLLPHDILINVNFF